MMGEERLVGRGTLRMKNMKMIPFGMKERKIRMRERKLLIYIVDGSMKLGDGLEEDGATRSGDVQFRGADESIGIGNRLLLGVQETSFPKFNHRRRGRLEDRVHWGWRSR